MRRLCLIMAILSTMSIACHRRLAPSRAASSADDTAALQVITSGHATWDELTPQGKAGALRALNGWLTSHTVSASKRKR